MNAQYTSGRRYTQLNSTENYGLVLVLVLVVDERGSFSAIDAHIFPCLIQMVLEDVD